MLIDLISKFFRLRKTGGKIVGGEEADPYSIPYQVKIISFSFGPRKNY